MKRKWYWLAEWLRICEAGDSTAADMIGRRGGWAPFDELVILSFFVFLLSRGGLEVGSAKKLEMVRVRDNDVENGC